MLVPASAPNGARCQPPCPARANLRAQTRLNCPVAAIGDAKLAAQSHLRQHDDRTRRGHVSGMIKPYVAILRGLIQLLLAAEIAHLRSIRLANWRYTALLLCTRRRFGRWLPWPASADLALLLRRQAATSATSSGTASARSTSPAIPQRHDLRPTTGRFAQTAPCGTVTSAPRHVLGAPPVMAARRGRGDPRRALALCSPGVALPRAEQPQRLTLLWQ